MTCQPAPDAIPGDGTIVFHFFDDYRKEAINIAKYIKDLMDKQSIPPREICLLYKQQPDHYGKDLIQALVDQGINARVENQFQDMMTEPIVQFILDLLQGASKPDGIEARQNLIYTYCSMYHIYTEEAMLMEEVKVRRRLAALAKCIANSAEWPPIGDAINQIIEEVTFQRFSANSPQYNDSKYFHKCKQDCLDSFRDAYAKSSSLTEAIHSFLGTNSIPLMTVHKSKGLEFEVVFFVGFEDKTFWKYHKQPEEDTRAFFVAMSRAKCHINFTFCTSRFDAFKKMDDKRSIESIRPIYQVLKDSELIESNNQLSG